nr:probable protein phosphatase 2C 51 isoform X2 [Physcomitrium patens]|eukprot:XP_024379595.1 probable protein phosphatase 2C 51 isoform X2 [Physcomitrella patens]
MATAKTCRSAHGGLMEESSGCENGAVSSRRRRMEIRGFKMMTNSSSFVEQPVSDCRLGNEDGCAINASETVGSSNSDRMSSGGSSNSGLPVEESDVSSTLTFAEGSLSPSGNMNNAVQGPFQALAYEPDNSGTADMAVSTASDILTLGSVDNNQTLDMPGVLFQHPSPLQATGANDVPDFSAVVPSDAGGPRAPCFSGNDCPPHGMVSLCGRRREMEDAVVAKSCFMKLPCNKVGGCNAGGLEEAPLHYFGVYDGHGGSQAANFCAERLHQALAEEVESAFAQSGNVDQNASNWEVQWQAAMTQCFKRMDAEVGGFCLEECECSISGNPRHSPEPIAPETVGTTAIVAVVGACQIIVGNCGDSRAVLSRGGIAIPLSVDHKPEREDEMARVEAAGGRVIYWNGYRVLGVLAMSRALGDRYLKPYVIPEPEVQCIKRAEDDECLILASDGLWDVMSNEAVCDIARRALSCRRNVQPPVDGQEEETPAAQAAALLVKLALSKGSTDNISVVVVDLKVPRDR